MKTIVKRVKNRNTAKEEWSYIVDSKLIKDIEAIAKLRAKRANITDCHGTKTVVVLKDEVEKVEDIEYRIITVEIL